jgi:hypothetical protein
VLRAVHDVTSAHFSREHGDANVGRSARALSGSKRRAKH